MVSAMPLAGSLEPVNSGRKGSSSRWYSVRCYCIYHFHVWYISLQSLGLHGAGSPIEKGHILRGAISLVYSGQQFQSIPIPVINFKDIPGSQADYSNNSPPILDD